MKNNIKRLFFVFLLTNFTTTLFAATTAASAAASSTEVTTAPTTATTTATAPAVDCHSIFAVTIPNQQGGLTLSADVLYWRPTPSDLYYNNNILLLTPIPATNLSLPLNALDPTYHWGFDATLGYRIPCTGNDISVTWTHLDQHRDSGTVNHDVILNPVLTVQSNAHANIRFKYDTVDFDIGQRVDLGEYFNLHFITGIRALRLEESRFTHNDMNFVGATSFLTLDLYQNSDFRGLGPQVGLEGHYCLGSGFGIVASSTISGIVGRTDSTLNENFFVVPATTPTTLNVHSVRKYRLLPALDANLGLDYTYNLCNCERSSIVVQAGWKVVHYWNAANILTSDITAPNLADGIRSNNDINVSFDGPYLGLKINL